MRLEKRKVPRADPDAWALLVDGREVGLEVDLAVTFPTRLRGWLGRRAAPPGRALWLEPNDAIHTLGMRFPVDVVFVDRFDRVRRVFARVGPWQARLCIGACASLELAAGDAARLGVTEGAHLGLASLSAPSASKTLDPSLAREEALP
jgi:hypothetical protein